MNCLKTVFAFIALVMFTLFPARQARAQISGSASWYAGEYSDVYVGCSWAGQFVAWESGDYTTSVTLNIDHVDVIYKNSSGVQQGTASSSLSGSAPTYTDDVETTTDLGYVSSGADGYCDGAVAYAVSPTYTNTIGGWVHTAASSKGISWYFATVTFYVDVSIVVTCNNDGSQETYDVELHSNYYYPF